jgi:hypothetical protein
MCCQDVGRVMHKKGGKGNKWIGEWNIKGEGINVKRNGETPEK